MSNNERDNECEETCVPVPSPTSFMTRLQYDSNDQIKPVHFVLFPIKFCNKCLVSIRVTLVPNFLPCTKFLTLELQAELSLNLRGFKFD